MENLNDSEGYHVSSFWQLMTWLAAQTREVKIVILDGNIEKKSFPG